MQWNTSRRTLSLDRPLVMGILNVTPDSFSDGGKFIDVDLALTHAEKMIADGADIIDVGGESTRPGSKQISSGEEIDRVVPVIEAIASRFDTPVSIDTTKSDVAEAALNAGAEIINDISGLRFDERIAAVAASTGSGLVLMHSRGSFEVMHTQPAVDDIVSDVRNDFYRALKTAESYSVAREQIALDIGIGFGKTFEQNLELLAKLDKIIGEFENYPMMVGTSRKSYIGKLLGDVPPDERLPGSLATAIIAAKKGAKILRVHDVRETVGALNIVRRIEGTK